MSNPFKPLFFREQKAAGERSMIDQQRRAVLIYSCVGLLVIDIFLIAVRIGPPGDFYSYNIVNVIHLCVTSALLWLYGTGKLSVVRAISALCIANQLELCVDICQCAVQNTPYAVNLIMGNMVLSGLNMLLILMAYIRVLPFVLAGLTMIAYGGCCLVGGESAVVNILPVFLVCFTVIALLGHRLSGNVHRLEREKEVLKEDERQILNLLELDKSQLGSCISLAEERGVVVRADGETARPDRPEGARQHPRKRVVPLPQREIDYAALQARQPELTPSEIEICELILKEKKLKEVVETLGKSESNITCQRVNIRKKLGLDKSDKLYDELRKRTRTE